MNQRPHILVVDDDQEITTLLSDYLERFGFTVHTAVDGKTMREQIARQAMDMVVLDVMLPGSDGLMLAREVRQHSRVPIIMLTARTGTHDRVVGLELGADDYMGKPFEPRELVARINTVLRRIPAGSGVQGSDDGVVRFDGWELRRDERRLTSPDGLVVPLSNAEYRLLTTFLSMPRRIFSRDQLMERARGRTMENFERSIDLLVSRLRQKLSDDPRAPSMIRTVRGAGYVFDVRSVQPQVGMH
ncbi:response regulator [Xylophilus rhododendri]|uniref:Response regulator n=1 Tax=Xylophilus rhododendri TaxID=2697032 RepID=A0A857J887_9BURK|nr:response regulator [Xylophilus rhododendri]QHJ00271.1 response regulator [Xylophilus rhododendri]